MRQVYAIDPVNAYLSGVGVELLIAVLWVTPL